MPTLHLNDMTIGKKLAHLLVDLGFEQKEVAARTGISEAQISRWAKGKRIKVSYGDALKLARALDVDLYWLSDDAQGYPPPGGPPSRPRASPCPRALLRAGYPSLVISYVHAVSYLHAMRQGCDPGGWEIVSQNVHIFNHAKKFRRYPPVLIMCTPREGGPSRGRLGLGFGDGAAGQGEDREQLGVVDRLAPGHRPGLAAGRAGHARRPGRRAGRGGWWCGSRRPARR